MKLVMLGMDLFVPLVMIICGIVIKHHPPEKRNPILGYRTKLSMKSDESWNFAQYHFSKTWIYSGAIIGTLSVLTYFVFLCNNILEERSDILVYVQVAILFVSCIPTEIALRRKYN